MYLLCLSLSVTHSQSPPDMDEFVTTTAYYTLSTGKTGQGIRFKKNLTLLNRVQCVLLCLIHRYQRSVQLYNLMEVHAIHITEHFCLLLQIYFCFVLDFSASKCNVYIHMSYII